MDKQKQIEELAKDIGIAFQLAGTTRFGAVAEILVDKWQRKLPENAVVLTREEYEKLKLFEERVRSGVCFTQKEWFDYCQKDSNERTSLLIKAKKDTRKETVEKYSEMLKELVAERNCNEDYDWEDVQIDGQIFIECVDEVAKKITESRDEFHSRDN